MQKNVDPYLTLKKVIQNGSNTIFLQYKSLNYITLRTKHGDPDVGLGHGFVNIPKI